MPTETRTIINGYTIDGQLFDLVFTPACGPWTCRGKCCEGGVLVDLSEQQKILNHSALVREYMDGTQPQDSSSWFDEPVEDVDFPSGRCAGTQEFNSKCVFLNREGRCVLQVAGEAAGMAPWGLKPFYCIAYPIAIENGVVVFDDMLSGQESCCTIHQHLETPGKSVIDACEVELSHVLGTSGYEELKRLQADRNNRSK